ncbi:MAG: NlpC/P60 family protein [Microgenomates group bacterium]
MVGTKLNDEITKYLGIPYFTNKGKYQNSGENVFVGKGSAREIALATIDLANQQNIKLLNLSASQIHNFQQKNHLGIDCSGLVCHLLDLNVNVRRTSADMLTSPPLAQPVNQPQTGDLIRQKDGGHVLLVLSINKNIITYIHSSRATHGVVVESKNITLIPHQGIWRITSPQLAHDK